jgi:hypothetical protein
MIGFVIGLFIGAMIGATVLGLCAAASRGNGRKALMSNRYGDKIEIQGGDKDSCPLCRALEGRKAEEFWKLQPYSFSSGGHSVSNQ